MRNLALFSIASVLLGGCAIVQNYQYAKQADAAQKKFDAALSHCKVEFPIAPAVPRAKCIGDALANYAREIGSEEADLIDVKNARVLVAAEQLDAGRITPIQYNAIIAEASAEENTVAQQRRNNHAVAAAAVQQAYAASQPTTCRRIGNSVTCY